MTAFAAYNPTRGGDPILVIEDDVEVRQSMAEVLTEEGYEVYCAANGAEALTILRSAKKKPAAIVLDLWMPTMDGFEFRAVQLGAADLASIPVVVVTAGGVAPKETETLRLAYVLRKPVDLEIFLRVVRRLASPSFATSGVPQSTS